MNLQLKLLEYIIYHQKLFTGIIALTDQCQMKQMYWRFGLKMANIFFFYCDKYICLKMANIFVWFFGKYYLLKLEERSCFFRISYRKEVVVFVVVVDVYKRLFLRYLQSFKFRYCYCKCELLDTGFTYLMLLSLSIVSLLRTVWWECLRRLFKFLFSALYVFRIIITGWLWYTFKHIKAFPNMCDVSLPLYNMSLMLLQ